MGKPQVEIDVNEASGRWSVDSLPMVLVPLHFILNHHRVLEAELGAERLEAVFRPAGWSSAHRWCEREAAHHGLSGEDVFRHYLKRMSQRGWARFEVLDLDARAGMGRIRLFHSVFVEGAEPWRMRCYRFAAWFEGALAYVRVSMGLRGEVTAREVQCASSPDRDHCLFEIQPAS